MRLWTVAAIVALLLAPARPSVPVRPQGPIRQVVLQPVVSGLTQPVYVTHAGDRSRRLFIVEQVGLVRIFRNNALLPTPYLDIRSRVTSGGEMGLLSVAFHPGYATNGRFFVNYTTETGGRRSVIAEYHVSPTNPDVADLAEQVLLQIPQPFANHNGGLNLFGPDGTLFIGLGDGGGSGDPQGNGQRLDTLLGKVLRIDVDRGTPYGIPRDNPFIRIAGVPREIYAYGLRNPWRFSFDRVTERLFLADVGQNSWEEIDIIEQGNNYGWNIMEGAHCYPPGTPCSFGGLVLPIAEYDHSQGCSVTGGYVYRGTAVPGLVGKYVFGDYCSGRVWTLTETSPGQWVMAVLLNSGLNISSFGEDQDGELYVVHHGGAVYKFAP